MLYFVPCLQSNSVNYGLGTLYLEGTKNMTTEFTQIVKDK